MTDAFVDVGLHVWCVELVGAGVGVAQREKRLPVGRGLGGVRSGVGLLD